MYEHNCSTITPMRLDFAKAEHHEALCRLMMQESLVSSADEATAVIESVKEENAERDRSTGGNFTDLLVEFFDVSQEDAAILVQKYFSFPETIDSPMDVMDIVEKPNGSDDYTNDSDEFNGPGDCELCGRNNIHLTRHHLIPKCTWRRTEPMILALWMDSFERKNSTDEFHELHHLIPEMDALAASVPACQTARGWQAAPGKRIIRDVLSRQTIDICRPCHDHIHRTHDNRTLALQYNTLDKLLKDPCIAKYAQWAHHQKLKNASLARILLVSKSRHRFKK
jgi:hypothetical protein